MSIESLKLAKEDKRGKTYQAEGFKAFYRQQGTVTGDNQENPEEQIYLVFGTAKITIEKDAQSVEAPAKIVIPANTYHKIDAITDIIFLLF